MILNCLILSCPLHVEVWWWIHILEFGGGFITFIKSSALAFFLVNDLLECHFKCFTGSQSTDKLFFAAGFEERFCIRCSTFQRNVFSDGYGYEKLQTSPEQSGIMQEDVTADDLSDEKSVYGYVLLTRAWSSSANQDRETGCLIVGQREG